MTVVAGILDNDSKKMYMGADRAISTPDDSSSLVFISTEPKVFKKKSGNRSMLLGAAGTVRTIQFFNHSLIIPPQPEDMDTMSYMVNVFATHLEGEIADLEDDFQLLVGYRGNFYTIENDFAVNSYVSDFQAIGSGHVMALSSLYTTGKVKPAIPAKTRLNIALDCAANYGLNIRAPFDVLSL